MQEGTIVRGKITGIKKYGAFVKVGQYDGLIHISEFSDDYVKDISFIVQVGDEVDLKVLEVDEFHERLKLSYKDANNISKKILRFAVLDIGFKSLGDNLDKWIEEGYQKICNDGKGK